jgi:hypothetical protein
MLLCIQDKRFKEWRVSLFMKSDMKMCYTIKVLTDRMYFHSIYSIE